jgi:hypothetical protein
MAKKLEIVIAASHAAEFKDPAKAAAELAKWSQRTRQRAEGTWDKDGRFVINFTPRRNCKK